LFLFIPNTTSEYKFYPGGGMERSSHHGDHRRANQLEPVRLLDKVEEIDVYEIDFVTVHGRIISSHDYDPLSISKGSSLREWVQFIVGERNKRLWIDAKEPPSVLLGCPTHHFDARLLFHRLEQLRKWLAQRWEKELTDYVWIGCQYQQLQEAFEEENSKVGKKWSLLLDMPSMKWYFWQQLLPLPLYKGWINDEILSSDFDRYKILAIDQSYFYDLHELVEFLRLLNLASGTILILYTFTTPTPLIELEGVRIIMQYDYTLQRSHSS
jgi:hypothetical protein